uniref:Integrase catalytic domain-containing protein n=1 Tax=Fagus sylvatica TaxID=28930 RepID=A0A2N9FQE6_FAGSY
MNGEEALLARDQTTGKKRKGDHADRPAEPHETRPKAQRNRNRRQEDRSGRGFNERFNRFTPLNAPVDHIFMQIRNDPALKWPGKLLTDPDKRPRDKYCRFHRDHGHNTEDCYDLKRQIEELIKQGKLQRFIEKGQREGRPKGARQQRPPGEAPPRPPLGEIHVITGGMAAGGTSQEDACKVFHPHDDALVVTMEIAGYSTRRVLIDNGSSADIIYLTAFQQMKIDKDQLQPIETPLVGFAGTSIYPLGMVTLQIIAGEMKGDQAMARECYLTTVNAEQVHQTLIVEERQNIAEPTEELEEIVLIEGDEKKTTRIGTSMAKEIRASVVSFLRGNADVFAWSHDDMPGISTEVISHKLNVNPSTPPVRQKRRVFAPERNTAVMEEVDKLLKAGFIREVYYPEWLANVVMVKKSTGKWRMCVDFTDLNKACPKDSYPLPRIDQLVDSTAGHKLLSFMDAFSGYNQIQMTEEGPREDGLHHKQRPFLLQGRNVEVYVDDMLVKSKKDEDHLIDLKETFQTLRRYNMKLNPAKCVFGVSSGKFLGFMVSQRGIEANPDKIKAILDMSPPKTVKEVQSLTGKAAALNRFVSRSTDKCLPFFRTLRKAFQWTEECQKAFEELKAYLSSPPLLSPSQTGPKPWPILSQNSLNHGKDEEELEEGEAWTVNIDGSSTKEMSGAGVVLVSPEKDKFEYALQLRFRATNNEAEYEALLAGLKLSKKPTNTVQEGGITSDSKREENEAADRLARLASSGVEIDGFVEIQGRPSTEEETINPISFTTTWMLPIIRYLKEGTLPADRAEAHKLRIRASRFQLLGGILYKMGFSRPHLRCLSPEEANYVIREVHEGVCGNHSGARSLAHKLTRAGYYWPSLLHDATQFVKACDKCQRFANVPRVPPEEFTPITSPWPFAQWGLDIMGPFPVGTKQAKFLVVAIDYFTKWVEAGTLGNNFRKECQVFRLEGRHLVDLGSHEHPQANGQVEVTNRTLLKQIKTRLEGAKSMWVEELPSVLWAYRTTVRTPTKETPFKLTFGTEAVIPVEIGLTTLRTTFHKEGENEGQLRLNLDLLDETRERAARRIALYQGKMARYYNAKVKLRRFEVGDWVLRKVTQATKDPSQGKLGPNWEGPYKIIQYYRRGTYHLEDRHGKKLPHPWNAEHLKKYYP